MAGRKPKVRPLPLGKDPEEHMRRQALGRRVKERREAQAWSLRDLAERSGLHRNEIMDVESGAVDARLGTINQLARALDCDPALLIVGQSVIAESGKA